jgi:hypothetical protein
MRRCLVVANRTLESDVLHDRLRTLASEGPSEFHLLVPVTHPRGPWSDGSIHLDAQHRLADALRRFGDLEAPVSGEVADDSSPVRAVGDVLLREPDRFDLIVLSTLPPGPSRWLKLDALHRMQDFGVPVIHVVETRENAAL